MKDPFGFILLLVVGLFALALAGVALRSGKATTIFRHSRAEKPGRFWYSVVFQSVLGIAALVLAVWKLFQQ